MRFRWLLLLITMIMTLVWQSPGFAQSGAAGSIVGYVTDQSGVPLRGVKIVATSDVQMGEKVAYTNEEGAFHVLGLPPGKYKVEASAEGMNSAVDENVDVGITSAAEVNILMEVKTAEETVTIVDRPEIVSTTKAGVKQTYNLKLVEATPFHWEPGNHCRLTVSIGVACSGQQPTSPEALLHGADLALYGAKRGGRNQVARAGSVAPNVVAGAPTIKESGR